MAEGWDRNSELSSPVKTFENELRQFILDSNIQIADVDKLFHYLTEDLGALSMTDLVEVTEKDLEDENAGMKPLHRRKFIRAIKSHFSSMTSIEPKSKYSDIDQHSFSSSSTHTTFHMESELFSSELDPGIVSPLPIHVPTSRQRSITIRYIHCKNLFIFKAKEKCVLNLDPCYSTVGDLYNLIASQQGISGDLKLELYFSEGYPLDVNDYTSKATLSKWGISNDCLLYTFARPLKQSGVSRAVTSEFNHSTPVDTENGPHAIEVRSHLHDTFTVYVDAETDNLTEIKRKIGSYVNIHPELFCLLNDEGVETPQVEDGSQLLMFPKQYYHLYNGEFDKAYGACTYQQIVEQTPAGIAKFYSCLFYLTRSLQEDLINKIVAYVDREYQCSPMTYALMCLFRQKTLDLLGHWVALVEGFFQLFQAILSIYCEVPENRVFEFSDYLWGLIIIEAQKRPSSSCERYSDESVTLNCPITEVRMMEPVNPQGSDTTYERANILKKIKNNEAIEGCEVNKLSEEDLIPNELIKRLLMCNMFRRLDISEVPIWKDPGQFFLRKEISTVTLPSDFTLDKFMKCNKKLAIYSPAKLPELQRSECYLTYYNVLSTFTKHCGRCTDVTLSTLFGCTVVSIGATKASVEGEFILYNPLYKPETESANIYIKETSLFAIPVVMQVKLDSFLNAKARAGNVASIPKSPYVSLTGSCMSLQGGSSIEEITQEPFEAIIVTLDVSSSMKEHIFSEKGEDYSRIRAAKDLFDAFVNRTLAYKFHHIIGLITFESEVEVKLHLTEVLSSLINSLSTVEAHGSTALYDANAKACELLQLVAERFPNCKRRILCLTDGIDNRSKSRPDRVLQMLRDNEVVMDSVLITGSQGNAMQKAISLGSGGYCFCPHTMAEATKVFEIEQLVSIRERPNRQEPIIAGSLNYFKDADFTPTDPYGKKEFQSGLSELVDQTTFTTTQRIVQQFLLLGIGVTTTSSAASSIRIRRIMKELRQYQRNPHPSVDVFPSENVTIWKMILAAPDNTPYETGVFLLYAKFSEAYPSQPPEVRFKTPIYHCNINSSGRICHSSLDNHYVPNMTMREIINYIYGLLMDPEPSDPLDSVLALELRENRVQYEAKARELTKKYANIDRDALRKEIVTEETEAPADMVCPLTQELFKDPVMTEHGHSYEREALMSYVSENGNIDPIAQKTFDVTKLTPNLTLKRLMGTLRQAQKKMK